LTLGVIVATITSMRKLSTDKRSMVLNALIEGSSVNATARMCKVSKLTVLRLLADVGSLCRDFHDVAVRDLRSKRIQVDEIWSFVGCKEKAKKAGADGHGDAWVWIAIDADSKLVVSFLLGGRDAFYAQQFMADVADRLATRVQLTSDGHGAYLEAVEGAFGFDVDYAQLVKTYGSPNAERGSEAKYSPPKINGAKKHPVIGLPERQHISTSFVERQNLTLRMSQRRFTRLTNAFSKSLVNHAHAVALHYFHYNFIRRHKTLGTTPAVAAGLTDREWKIDDLVAMLENEERKLANGGRINRADRT